MPNMRLMGLDVGSKTVGVAAKALETMDIKGEAVRASVIEIIGEGEKPVEGHIPFTPRAKRVFELSLREATGQVPSANEAGAASAPARDPRERPIILRTEMVAGHAGPSGREGRWAERCEEFAFALGQVGVTQ